MKKAMEVTHALGGIGYNFWGGREGYSSLLTTQMGRELPNMARKGPAVLRRNTCSHL